tara:strand:+ start:1196 stop:1438 length:243 start_codon:yes stop_codon:yes gene_type:complete
MLKVSNIFEDKRFLETESFNSLSPKMKDAVSSMFEMINDDKDIVNEVDRAIEKVAKEHGVKKEDIESYIEDETNKVVGSI